MGSKCPFACLGKDTPRLDAADMRTGSKVRANLFGKDIIVVVICKVSSAVMIVADPVVFFDIYAD
jgi:hypothetical protein